MKNLKSRICIYQPLPEVQAQLNESAQRKEKMDKILTNIATILAYLLLMLTVFAAPLFMDAMMWTR